MSQIGDQIKISYFESFKRIYQLYFPPQEDGFQDGGSFNPRVRSLLVATTSLTLLSSWVRRPFFSILPIGAGVIAAPAFIVRSFIQSYSPSLINLSMGSSKANG